MTDTPVRSRLLRAPLRGRLVLAIVLGLATGAVAWYFGMDTTHAIALGLVVSAVVVCFAAVPEHQPAEWTPGDPETPTGIRRDVIQLSWSLHSRSGAVAPSAHRRLRELATTVLARHDLGLDDPADAVAIQAALGQSAWNAVRPGERALPSLAEVESTLDALSRLDGATPTSASVTTSSARDTAAPRSTDAR